MRLRGRFVLLAVLAVPLWAAPIFRNPQPVRSAEFPGVILAADFNGDGHSDVLCVGCVTSKIATYLNDGTYPFPAPVETPFPLFAQDAATGDVNGDGNLDVALSNPAARTMVMMLGSGNGSFTQSASINVAAPRRIGRIVLADFNSDSHLDLAASVHDEADFAEWLYVWPGGGDGHFAASAVITSAYLDAGLVAADVDGDAKTDLVSSSPLKVLTGNGDGTFVEHLLGNDRYPSVAVADFNHDGKVDIATSGVSVLLGNGDATFAPPVQYPVKNNNSSIAAIDLDADGNLDLLVADYEAATVSVLRGNADGTFQAPAHFVAGPGAYPPAFGDFDRDGDLDFVALGVHDSMPALALVRGNGGGSFRTERAFHTGFNIRISDTGVADVNHDGKSDAVVLQRHPGATTYDLGVLFNDGTGLLAAPILTDSTRAEVILPPRFALGDVDGDGNVDALVVEFDPSASGASVLRGNGAGGFAAPRSFHLEHYGLPTLGQFTGDAALDVFIAGQVYPGNGNGTFGPPVTTQPAPSGTNAFGDVNGDGKLDYVATALGGTILNLNDGNGHFTSLPITQDYVRTSTLADFDGDGRLDLLLAGDTAVQTRFGSGDGTFGSPRFFTIPLASAPVSATDITGDGHLDLVFGTTVFVGDGAGGFLSRSRFRTRNPGVSAFADMDGNGSPDLVVGKSWDSDVAVLLTRTAADPTAPVSISLAANRNTAPYADPITMTATVTGGATLLTGAVRFDADNHPLALVELDRDGKAVFDLRWLPGAHTITATYTGDEYYAEGSASTGVTITKGTLPPIAIGGAPNPGPVLQPVHISFTTAAPPDGLPGPSGVMTIREGATVIATLPASGGAVDYTWTTLGTHVVTIDYAGDANYEAATGSYIQQITKLIPVLALQLTPATNIVADTSVTVRLSIANPPGASGSVSFYRDGTYLQTVGVSQAADGIPVTFDWGMHTMRADYSGDDYRTGASTSTTFEVYAGNWGAALQIRASGGSMTWSRVIGASLYIIWRKTSAGNPWEMYTTSTGNSASYDLPPNTSWLFAVSAYDANNNDSAKSPPDLATNVPFTDAIAGNATKLRAAHLVELRTAAAAVRAFAALAPYIYTNPINAGDPLRAIDVAQLRIALNEARNAIGLPVVNFTDPVLTPGQTPMRAPHVLELRAGTD